MYRLTILICLLSAHAPFARQGFFDRTHQSRVFGEPRNYRILLPPGYDGGGKSYPVIYYFHGHSDRYTLEHYDKGSDTIPKMLDYVARNDVIVVTVDGYVAKDYTGFYGGSPWDVRLDGGDMDFGLYFPELVGHIDSTYRTLTDRRHRATSGLSMGGFMSLYLSARLPQLIGSASAFNPGPEFYAGDKGRRVLWRPKDHVVNHGQTMVRVIHASGDFISQYHEETRDAYVRATGIDFEYRRDEYHRHWATSIAETFDFHKRAFANSTLDNVPVKWSHANPYSSFEAWGWNIEAEGKEAGLTYLSDVTQGGFRLTSRSWAPDGPALAERRIVITTAPLYSAGKAYTVVDYDLSKGTTTRKQATADPKGSIVLEFDGAGHQVSLVGPGTGAQPPVMLPLTTKDALRVPPQADVELPVRIYNPRGDVMTDVKLALTSDYPTVQILAGTSELPKIGPGEAVDLSKHLRVRFTAGAGYFAPARLQLKMTYDGWYETSSDIDVLVIPEIIPAPAAIEVLDGRKLTLQMFRQRGNQGGGSVIDRTVTEGKGNGNGILEPGEEATVWVKLVQGMDPFDKNSWHRCKVYSESPWIMEIGDIQEEKQREWTGAQERTSLIRVSEKAPSGTVIPVLLDNESWSFHYTPDVRYGPEPLYQAIQLHTRHLHRHEFRVPGSVRK